MKPSCSGMGLLEIFLAITILTIAIVPIYTHINRQTSIALNTEKMQMADKTLQSIKEEMVGTPFTTLAANIHTLDTMKDAQGKYPLTELFYPVTNPAVVVTQRKYKDFVVSGFVWFVDRRSDPTQPLVEDCVQADLKINWTIPEKTMERTRSFMIVSPK